MDNTFRCNRIIQYRASNICDVSKFTEIDFDAIGVDIKKISYNKHTSIIKFKFVSTIGGRIALADLIRELDKGWSSTLYWKQDHPNHIDELRGVLPLC